MKISFTLPELQSGVRSRRVSKKQMQKVRDAINNKRPVAIATPLQMKGRLYTVALLSKAETDASKLTHIHFTPISCRGFQVIDARTKELRQLTVEFDNGTQYSFDKQGARKSTYKLAGEGVDPEMEPVPELLVAHLLRGPICPIMRHLFTNIAFQYGRVALAA